MSLSPAQAAQAASAYRALIRAQRLTFRGDSFALQAAHARTRTLFADLRSKASSSPADVDEHIEAARQVAQFLRQNVVQGVRKEDGNYSLRFTKETERGDNMSIKAPSPVEAKPMRGPTEANANVKRRRRAPASSPAQAPPCCQS